MSDIFKIRDYTSSKWRLIERNCVICNQAFDVPYHQRNVVTTCCKYCQCLALSWKKNKGKYILCEICDKPVWCQPKKIKKFCSIKCKDLYAKVVPNINSPALRTGRKKYYGPNWLIQRRAVRKRDNYCCTKCGISELEYGQELSVHHITPFVYFSNYEDANNLNNLISLCELCHRKEHSGENHMFNFNKDKIKFQDRRETTSMKQQEKATEVLRLLLKTDMTLTEISKVTGMSYSRVSKLYGGESWKQLYKIPAFKIAPRKKVKYRRILGD